MLVKVLMGDIGNHANIELAGIHPVLRPAMRGGFEHHMGQSGLDHPGKITLNIRSIRCGDMKTGIENFIANDGVDR